MTRQEHLKFCKTCVNHQMDLKVGLTCQLTGRIADFENECDSYKLDEQQVAELNDEVTFQRDEINTRLSEEKLNALKAEQNLPIAIFAGIIIGILAAIAWAFITVTTGYKVGIVAIGVGAAGEPPAGADEPPAGAEEPPAGAGELPGDAGEPHSSVPLLKHR